MPQQLSDFSVLSFDCYGTLIDWEAGIRAALRPLLAGAADRPDDGRALALFGEHEHRLQRERPGCPYPELLAAVHDALARDFGIRSTAAMNRAFGESIADWPAFPDSSGALRALQARYRLVILSNVDRRSFAASADRLGIDFDAVYTAEDIGSYKPDRRNFDYLLRHVQADFGLDKADILHTAQSLLHDHVPARAVGLANAWIDRQGLSRGGSWGVTAPVEERPAVDFQFDSLEAMATAVATAFGP